ncbi:MAG TPA: RNA polymerase sigma factor, partial [Gammaproteobacteria bacterium]|nr:RNA polymerase sigma factor [Gammaproteobacteria bacterium]
QLLERYCRDSDMAAFSTFYRNQSGKLWQFLCARGCTQDDAYDLLAEAFFKFIGVVCNDLRSPVALLYRIAINMHIDSYRRDRTSPVSTDSEAVDRYAEPAAGDLTERDYVQALLRTLPQDEQNLLFMRYWSGMTHKEIAAVLEMPEGTIRRQVAAILNKLQQRWQED